MKPLTLMSGALLALAPLVSASGQTDERALDSLERTDWSDAIGLSQDSIGHPSPRAAGVNLVGGTLMVTIDGSDYAFELDDETEVEGSAGREDSRFHAVRIEIEEPRQSEDSSSNP